MYGFECNIVLETPDLILRGVRMSDAQALLQIIGHPDVNRYMLGSSHVTLEDTVAWITNLDSSDYNFSIVEKLNQDVIGCATLSRTNVQYEWEAGMCFHPAYWNRGYATQSLHRLVQWGKVIPDMKDIIGIVAKENLHSILLLMRCGFNLVEDTQYSKYNGSRVFPAWKFKHPV